MNRKECEWCCGKVVQTLNTESEGCWCMFGVGWGVGGCCVGMCVKESPDSQRLLSPGSACPSKQFARVWPLRRLQLLGATGEGCVPVRTKGGPAAQK